jgi:hypothetical protein
VGVGVCVALGVPVAVAVGVAVAVAVGVGVGVGVGVAMGVGAGAGVTTAIGSTVLAVGAAGSFGDAATFGIVTRTLLESAPARFFASYARTVYRYVRPCPTFESVYDVVLTLPRLLPSRRTT